MLRDFINEVIVLVIGKQYEMIGNLIDSKKHVNEFLIAKKMDITINQTRNILYRLADQGLVSSIRKKDKKKGWYTYLWKIESIKLLEFLKKILINRIEQVENQIKNRESKQFYVCKTCNIEFNEENALLYDFTCNECGDIFTIKDNTKLLRELNKNKSKLNKELKEVDEIMDIEKEKLEKVRQKELEKLRILKKEARRTSAKKAAVSRKKTAELKKQAEDKAGKGKKKSVKKKPSKKKIVKGKKKVSRKKIIKKSGKKPANKTKKLFSRVKKKVKKAVKKTPKKKISKNKK